MKEYDRIQRVYNVSFTISRIQCKITTHRRIGNVTDTQEERQPREINPKMAHILELAGKDFKGAVITMLSKESKVSGYFYSRLLKRI